MVRVPFEIVPRSWEYANFLPGLWAETFASLFRTRENWRDLAKRQISQVNVLLNSRGPSVGELTLFLKDPILDRLNLIISTVQPLNTPDPTTGPGEMFFHKRDENFDIDKRVSFYQLFSSVGAASIRPEEAQRRGLTGWVALTGVPLLLTSERSEQCLNGAIQSHPRAAASIAQYGKPVWGNRIAELGNARASRWETQFLAVPVPSAANDDEVMGVLRYSRPIGTRLLEPADQVLMEQLARVLGELIFATDWIKKEHGRARYREEVETFRRERDINRLLVYLAKALNSRIATLYVNIQFDGRRRLRLLDAYGLPSGVVDMRLAKKIQDYDETNTGLTWALLHSPVAGPQYFSSLVHDSAWRGRNARCFYDMIFHERGFQSTQDLNLSAMHEVLRLYRLQMIGTKILSRQTGEPIGVLKVEIPNMRECQVSYAYSDGDRTPVPIEVGQ